VPKSIFVPDASFSDDAPTVISQILPKSVRPEDLLRSDLRGQHLSHFELLEPIGAGGMAAVIRARDTQLDRTVALKILPPDMAANPESVLRFQQEARAAAKLDHENIARVFFCGEDQGLHFISFEFVEGEDLRTHIRKHGKLPVADAVNYLLQIAGGLAHAAERGVVHRDIKPSNIIVTPDGRAKLVDMGLARSMEPHADPALTESGVTLGTFDYISPEQALEPRQADVRSDIYSLGCTFYHALTGQAPVPQGTAAKKLHHHQNVGPVDPRQLNPDIPDEIAGILARMMAKDPKDRYQRPEDLIQHLSQQQGAIGAVSNKSSGISVIQSSPARSNTGFLWWASAAAVVLLTVFVLQGILSRNKLPSKANAGDERTRNSTGIPPDGGNSENKPAKTQVVHNAEELALALQNPSLQMDIRLATDLIDLSKDADSRPPLVFAGEGSQVTIRPTEGLPHRPVIRLTGSAAIPVFAALTIQKGHVTLRHLRFEIDAGNDPGVRLAALKLQETGNLTVEDCEFEQIGASSSSRLSSVLVEGPSDDPSPSRLTLVLEKCYFTGRERNGAPTPVYGQDAVTLDGSARVQLLNCAFGPHNAIVHFLEGKSQLEVRYISALMTDGAVFLVEQGARADIPMLESLISCPDNHLTSRGAALISQKGGSPEDVDFSGHWNCYHDLDDFWIINGVPQRSKNWPMEDQILAMSPWLDKDPLSKLREGNPKKAFQPDLNVPELRFSDRLVGVHKCTWGLVFDTTAPQIEEKKTELVNTLIVDPTVAKDGNGVYTQLEIAIAHAKPGDTILLKHGPDRVMKIDRIRLEKPQIDLTIKPYEGYHPILTLGQSPDSEAGMFRLHDGKLQLKDLEFLLTNDPAAFQSRAVVSVVGDGECVLSNCVVTLDKGDSNPDRDFAMVTLLDSASVMKMEPQSTPHIPEIRVEKCFIRGKGEMIAVRSSRPFHLVADKSLVVLDGSLFAMKGSSRDIPVQPPCSITLSRITTYLTQHLICLRALEQQGTNRKGLVQTQVTSAADCLFAAAGDKSLVHLDGVDNPDDMNKYLTWAENRNNEFSKYDRLLDQQASGQAGTPPAPYDRAKWDSFTNANGTRYEPVKFAAVPSAESSLTQVPPTAFRVQPQSGMPPFDCGVVINDLPAPFKSSMPPMDK
jgi:serine/threonine protein kinase